MKGGELGSLKRREEKRARGRAGVRLVLVLAVGAKNCREFIHHRQTILARDHAVGDEPQAVPLSGVGEDAFGAQSTHDERGVHCDEI